MPLMFALFTLLSQRMYEIVAHFRPQSGLVLFSAADKGSGVTGQENGKKASKGGSGKDGVVGQRRSKETERDH